MVHVSEDTIFKKYQFGVGVPGWSNVLPFVSLMEKKLNKNCQLENLILLNIVSPIF